MSTKKKPVIDAKKALPELKKLGLFKEGRSAIPGRGKLTDSQTRRIRAAYKKYAYVINTPKTEFVKKDISHYTKKDKDALKRGGYTIINDKIWLDKQGSEKVQVQRVQVPKLSGKGYETQIRVKRTIKGGARIETELHGAAGDVMGWRENLLRQYENGDFKDGNFVGMKIGRGGVFRRKTLLNLRDVYKYLEEFEPRDIGTNKDELLDHVILIRYDTSDYRVLGEIRTKKERDKLSRQRSKKAAKVKKATTGKAISGSVSRSKKK